MSVSKILIVRTDRIGDVLLTTPMSAAIRAASPGTRIYWLVRPYTAPLLKGNSDVDGILIDRGQSTAELVQTIKEEKFEAAIVALPRFRVSWTLWRARIPRRIGPASKWYSVFFTDRVWQHRSAGEKHEADFNLDLLAPLGMTTTKRYPTKLILAPEEKQKARQALEGHRISFKKPVVVLHPGSGGSSARWPLRSFIELGDRLQEAGCDVVVTSGPGEDYQYPMIDQMRRIPVFIAGGSVNLREFAGILASADLVVTNSTGPLHMAVALGIPTVSVFSPVTTCHPNRWGPYPDAVVGGRTHAVALSPDEGSLQEGLVNVSVDQVWALARERLGPRKGAAG